MERKPTLLIVDDEMDNIKLLAQILKGKYVTRVAFNGNQALERVLIDPVPDLILLDIMMPDMDGYETCRRLKENPDTSEIPVLFLTAKTEKEDIVAGFKLGAVDYLTKPFNREELLVRINTHIQLKLNHEKIAAQNRELSETAALREDVDRIIRHDMKTPLSSIINIPQVLLEDEKLTELGKKYLRMMEESGYRLLNMINLSTDLFKMEKGVYEMNFIPVNILKIFDKIHFEVTDIIRLREVTLQINIDGEPRKPNDTFSISGDPLLCHTMLLNLLQNAIEASPEKGPVTIDLKKNGMKTIRFHNEGAVPEKIRNRFFQKYVTFGKPHGTGLGTYCARLICETHQGSIRMETDYDKGTAVTLTFPLT